MKHNAKGKNRSRRASLLMQHNTLFSSKFCTQVLPWKQRIGHNLKHQMLTYMKKPNETNLFTFSSAEIKDVN